MIVVIYGISIYFQPFLPIQFNDAVKQMYKNIEKHTAQPIVSWPNPKQWDMGHTSDLIMIR